MKQMLSKSIELADQLIRAAKKATSFKVECLEILSKAEKLAAILHQMLNQPSTSEIYERPVKRIIDETKQALESALSLVVKCSGKGLMKGLLIIIPAADLRISPRHLENSVENLSWLLRICFANDHVNDYEYLGLPPIAANEPILCLIWEQIAILYTGSLDDRSDAAASLVSLARDNDRYGKLIIEEGGVQPLLKLVKEGKMEGQENAARAIGFLGRDPESVEHMIHTGVCTVFAKILKEGAMKVQAVIAWAVSELAGIHPQCQDLLAQHNIVRLLVGHLAFEIVQEHVQNVIVINKATSVLAIVMARNHLNSREEIEEFSAETSNLNKTSNQQNLSPSGTSFKGREVEDPVTKDYMKTMAAKALCNLVRGNSSICRYLTESRALMSFVFLLGKGSQDVRHQSAIALMEITGVAEQDSDLRRSTFRSSSPACKVVVDQLIKTIETEENYDILIPCIKAVGNLAKTFRVAETRIIAPSVRLLDERAIDICRDILIVLTKFTCKDNHLHVDYAKEIIQAGGAKHLVELVYFGEKVVQPLAALLVCYLALYVSDSVKLVEVELLTVLEWASKQSFVYEDKVLDSLVAEAKSKLEPYQWRREF